MATLAPSDASVLSALFDPEGALDTTISWEPATTATGDAYLGQLEQLQQLEQLEAQEKRALRLVNSEAPAREQIDEAVAMLSQIIQSHPSYASAWNNRAQARRLYFEAESWSDGGEASQVRELVRSIWTDLDQAVALAGGDGNDRRIPRTGKEAKVLSSAHAHRGYLVLLASRAVGAANESDEAASAAAQRIGRVLQQSVAALQGRTADDLEAMAAQELQRGGRYGDEAARRLAVQINPYAKLCGSIVREALAQEMRGG